MYMSRHPSARSLSFSRRALGGVFGLLALGVVSQVQAAPADRWVNDSLNTFVRSGPTDGYRIVGALKSGQKVTLLTTQAPTARFVPIPARPCGFPAATCRTAPANSSACLRWSRK